MKVIGYTKVSEKFLTTVPKDVRRLLELKVGDNVVWVEQNGKVYVKRA